MEKKLSYIFKKSVKNIYIVRHPEVENFKQSVFNGSIDVDLSKEGYKEANNLYNFFKNKNIKTVFSSPMKRCKIVSEQFRETAEIIYDDRIKERNFGIFETLSWETIEMRYKDESKRFLDDPFYYKVKGGESFYDVENRVVDFIDDRLRNLSKDVLIVAHGGVNRIFIANFLAMDRKSILSLSQDYACINHFQTDGDFMLAKLINGASNCDRCF